MCNVLYFPGEIWNILFSESRDSCFRGSLIRMEFNLETEGFQKKCQAGWVLVRAR